MQLAAMMEARETYRVVTNTTKKIDKQTKIVEGFKAK